MASGEEGTHGCLSSGKVCNMNTDLITGAERDATNAPNAENASDWRTH